MTTTQKKEIVDNILELLIQLTEDGDNTAPQTAKAPTADKVEMLTIKEDYVKRFPKIIEGKNAQTSN